MADEDPTGTVDVPKDAPQDDPPKDDRPPENHEAEWKRKAQRAEREKRDLQERLEALEQKDQSELERERKARERAEQENQSLASKVEQLEKGSWVRDAAAAADFHNPSAAASFLDLSEIEDAADAQRAIKDLAKREGYLVKPAEEPKPQVGQVLKDGQTVQQPRSPQEAAAIQEQTIRERDAEAVTQALTEIGVYQPQQ
jgi:hypothetical protein